MLYRLLSFFVVFKSLPNELHEVDLRHSSGLVLLMRILVCNGLSFPLVPKLPVAYKICRHISRRRSVEEFSFLEANVTVFYIIFFSVVKGAVSHLCLDLPCDFNKFCFAFVTGVTCYERKKSSVSTWCWKKYTFFFCTNWTFLYILYIGFILFCMFDLLLCSLIKLWNRNAISSWISNLVSRGFGYK